jgi:hypothetical protein
MDPLVKGRHTWQDEKSECNLHGKKWRSDMKFSETRKKLLFVDV